MSTTPHPLAPEEIMAHLDGELSPARAQSVSTHIASCAICQELVTSLRNTSSSLSHWTIGSVPARLQNNVAKSILQFGSSGSNRFPHTHSWTRKQWIGGLAVTATAAVFLLSISLPTLNRSHSAAQKASAVAQRREKAQARKRWIVLPGRFRRKAKTLCPGPVSVTLLR